MENLGNVFMLDDDKFLLEFYRDLLESRGYKVFATTNAYQFIQYAKEVMPSVAFLDINMPGMTGWEVLTHMSKDEALSNIPVVMLTVEADAGLAIAKGAAHFMNKPVNLENMFEIVHSYCEGQLNHDVLLLEDYEPLFSTIFQAIRKRKLSCFRVHNYKAANAYLGKNHPKVVGVHLSGDSSEQVRKKLKHEAVYLLNSIEDLDQFSV